MDECENRENADQYLLVAFHETLQHRSCRLVVQFLLTSVRPEDVVKCESLPLAHQMCRVGTILDRDNQRAIPWHWTHAYTNADVTACHFGPTICVARSMSCRDVEILQSSVIIPIIPNPFGSTFPNGYFFVRAYVRYSTQNVQGQRQSPRGESDVPFIECTYLRHTQLS